jgi:hypothetical protein
VTQAAARTFALHVTEVSAEFERNAHELSPLDIVNYRKWPVAFAATGADRDQNGTTQKIQLKQLNSNN